MTLFFVVFFFLHLVILNLWHFKWAENIQMISERFNQVSS